MFTWLYHIKIVDRPIKIVIFHSYVAVYQRVTPLIFSGTSHWDEKEKTPEKNRWRIIPKDAGRLHESPSQNVTPASIVCHLVIWNSYGKHLFLQGKSIHEYNWQLFIANFVTLPDGMYIYICVYIYMCVCVLCVCQDEIKQNDKYTHVWLHANLYLSPSVALFTAAWTMPLFRIVIATYLEQNAMCNVLFNHKVTIYLSLLDMMLVWIDSNGLPTRLTSQSKPLLPMWMVALLES